MQIKPTCGPATITNEEEKLAVMLDVMHVRDPMEVR